MKNIWLTLLFLNYSIFAETTVWDQRDPLDALQGINLCSISRILKKTNDGSNTCYKVPTPSTNSCDTEGWIDDCSPYFMCSGSTGDGTKVPCIPKDDCPTEKHREEYDCDCSIYCNGAKTGTSKGKCTITWIERDCSNVNGEPKIVIEGPTVQPPASASAGCENRVDDLNAVLANWYQRTGFPTPPPPQPKQSGTPDPLTDPKGFCFQLANRDGGPRDGDKRTKDRIELDIQIIYDDCMDDYSK